jgi:myxalamid-type polyketide synthase MxaB
VRIEVGRADVVRRVEIAGFLDVVDRTMPPLRGVVHAAGALDDGVLREQSWARFARVMAPKVEGAWNLHSLTLGRPLDFFVLFGSGASFLGSPGQGNHAAANAFLDALAHHRRALALPAMSIDWGAWAGIGAAAERNATERLESLGLGTIAPAEGLEVLERLLARPPAQVAVLPARWSEVRRRVPEAELPFFGELREARSTTSKPERAAHTQGIVERLGAAPAAERRSVLLEHLRLQVVRVLGLEPGCAVDPRRPLNELGLDSLMAVELRNELAASTGLKLSSTLLFDFPTLDALAARLARDLAGSTAVREATRKSALGGGERRDGSGQLDALSEQEVLVLLADELAAIKKQEGR